MSKYGRHPGQGRVTEMVATRSSRCHLCGGQIDAGEMIKQIGYRNWGHPDCVERAGRV